jgi:hypothetical protein
MMLNSMSNEQLLVGGPESSDSISQDLKALISLILKERCSSWDDG